MYAILKPHPGLDYFFGFNGNLEIPTKQDKFEPIVGKELYYKEGDQFFPITDSDLYLKRKGKSSIQFFEEKFRELLKQNVGARLPFAKEIQLEVIVSVSMTKKRLKTVDIDNLLKSILDCLNGIVYTDDSQIINIYGNKEVNPYKSLDGLMIGVRKIDSPGQSWFKGIKLAYFEYQELSK